MTNRTRTKRVLSGLTALAIMLSGVVSDGWHLRPQEAANAANIVQNLSQTIHCSEYSGGRRSV